MTKKLLSFITLIFLLYMIFVTSLYNDQKADAQSGTATPGPTKTLVATVTPVMDYLPFVARDAAHVQDIVPTQTQFPPD